MKFNVNDTCISCGMCANICPEVFHMRDDTGMAEAIGGIVPAESEAAAQEAMISCPAGAIEEQEE